MTQDEKERREGLFHTFYRYTVYIDVFEVQQYLRKSATEEGVRKAENNNQKTWSFNLLLFNVLHFVIGIYKI